jgi:mRNA-degrading endonuclease toxin of MazEF toxin-antitoxin module
MEIGDVYSVEIPLAMGMSKAGARPAIVAQAPQFGDRLTTVLIVPRTSRNEGAVADLTRATLTVAKTVPVGRWL